MSIYTISSDCIMCGACESECPKEAISAGDTQYVIDPEKCTGCGTCAETCPVEAPHPVA
ncbi:MAG: 4Fe-4S binding protein [Anaerolineaceae bacterium]